MAAVAVPKTKEERLALIRDNLAEELNFDIIEKIIEEGGTPKIYWGLCLQLILKKQTWIRS